MTLTTLIYFLIGTAIGIGILWGDRHMGYLRSVVVLAVMVPLSLFVVTSTGNTIGQGLILALLVGKWIDMYRSYRNVEHFNQRFAPGARQPFTEKEVRGIVIGWSGLTLVVSGIVVAQMLGL